MRCLFLNIAALALLAAPCLAAEPDDVLMPPSAISPNTLTLQQTQEMALGRNREVQNANLEVSKNESALKAIITTRFPKLLALAYGGQTIDSPFGLNGTVLPLAFQPITQQYRLDLQCQQARLALKIAREQLRLARQRVVADVKRTYLTMVSLQSSITTREQNLAFLETLERYTLAEVGKGSALKVDAALIKAKVARAQYDLEKDRDDVITLGQTLNRLLNRPVMTPIQVVETPTAPLPQVEEHSNITRALAQRPEIHQTEMGVKTFHLQEKVAISKYIPDVSFGVAGIFSEKIPVLPARFLAVGFLATWEPWDWGRRIDESKIANRQMRQGRVTLSDLSDKVSVEADNARRALRLVLYEVDAAGQAESSQKENLRVLTKRYQAGSSLMKDVTEAQAEYSQAITENVLAKTHYATAKVDWDLAEGNDF